MRVKIILSYKGTNYAGWQVQKNGLTVQEVLENALFKLTGTQIRTTCAGRTDSGVHARGQVAHFDIETTIPAEKLPFVLNTMLPRDIRVLQAEEVPPTFNARYSAKGKRYIYNIYNSPHSSALNYEYTMHVPQKLDLDKMQQCAKRIEGTHDFKAFCAQGSSAKTTVRTVYGITIKECEDNLIQIIVEGNGFLYNMVRIIAGTLIEAGKGKLTPEDIDNILLLKNRSLAGFTAEPQGLVLDEVFYD